MTTIIPFDFKNLNESSLKTDDSYIRDEVVKTYDQIANVSLTRTFENTVQPMISLWTLLRPKFTSFHYAKNFYTSKTIRDLGSELECEIEKFVIDQNQRKDVYNAFKSYGEQYSLEKDSLTAEECRYYEHSMRDFRRSGLHLEGKDSEEYIAMKKQHTEYKSKYSQNLNEENTSFGFTRLELNGMPPSWFNEERLVTKSDDENNDVFKVTLKYPDFIPAMKYAKNRDVRKKIALAYYNRCSEENGEIFKQTIKLRYDMAQKLGYATHADYSTEVKITKTGKNAVDFIENLNSLFTDLYKKDNHDVLEFAQNYKDDPFTEDTLRDWDRMYYNRLFTESQCSLDMESIKKYFPLDVVRNGIFKIYQQILGLKFQEIETDNKWHESVTLFSVNDDETDELLGYFYLDMFPREGKYAHAAAFYFINPCDLTKITGENKRQPSIITMACNFPQGECISFNDVVTFFHEFGHVMHQICSKPQLEEYCGFGVEWDFVEAPSQMLENWCYCEQPLKLMSKCEETGESLPSDVIEKLKKMKRVLSGYSNKRQFMFGIFDLRAHSLTFENGEDFDPKKLWYETAMDVLDYDLNSQDGDVAPYASFGHLMGGYDAGYYGYMRAQTYSANMFHAVFEKDPLSRELGMRYRKKLLEPGSTKDGLELLKDFLGGEPDDKYFLKDQGL
jgi:Zn-dependent oligopeptidase